MQRLPVNLITAELATTPTTYTSPNATKTTISACSVTNKTATARYVTVTIGTKNVCYQRVVAPNETFNVNGAIGQTMAGGDVLSAVAEANTALDMVCSGYTTV